MNLEGDHVGSLLNSRRSQNDVELGEGLRVMHLNRLRRGIESINKDETDPVTEVVTKRIEYTFTVDIKGDGINLDTEETTENTTGEEGTGK